MTDRTKAAAPDSPRYGLVDLVPFLRSRRREVLRTALAGTMAHLATIGTLALMGDLAGRAMVGAGASADTRWSTGLLACVGLAATGRWLQTYWGHDLAFALVEIFQLGIYDGLERAAPRYVLGKSSGDLASTATSDAEALEGFYAHLLGDYAGAVIAPALVIAGLALVDPLPALLLASLAPLVASVPFWLAKRAGEQADASRDLRGRTNGLIVELVQGLGAVASYGAGRAHMKRIEDAARAGHHADVAYGKRSGIEKAITELLLVLSLLGSVTLGAYLVRQGRIAAASLPMLIVTSAAAMAPLTLAAESARKLGALRASARRVLTIFHQPVQIVADAGAHATSLRGDVRFEDVTFDYGLGRGPVLSGVTFTVPAGATVALVGASGAGKSTCASLLLRFWDPTSGRITVGGRDLRDLQVEALRDAIAWVPQDAHVFDVDIASNVRLARPDAPMAMVEDAIRAAQLDAWVASLPEGYATRCGERGARLSGGQRQRLAIARAWLKDAPVIVLDEPTSSLDPENERAVHEALRRLRSERTVLLIAHSPTMIRTADLVVVLGNGRVLESGTYDELIRGDGAFRSLMRRG